MMERRRNSRSAAHLAWVSAAVLLLASAAPAEAAEYVVDPGHAKAADTNPGTAEKPFKTAAKALGVAKAGDTILLGSGEYPAVSIPSTYSPSLTISAAKGARPVFTGGLTVSKGGGVRVVGVTFTWPEGGRPTKGMTPFIDITGSKDVEIADCEIFDDPNATEWVGWACSIDESERVTVRDTKAHHFYFGFCAEASKDVTFRNLDIRLWSFEDGIRVQECEGPVLIDGCYITNAGIAGRKGGHVDAIQVVFWSDNLTIRNCHIHGVMQAIGAFACASEHARIKKPRRKNWHIEGNLIYDVYTPHACTVCDTDGVVVINNTFPQNHANLFQSTGGVVKNNIFGSGSLRKDCIKEADYNLWISGGEKSGEHDRIGVDPKFVNTPLLTFKTEWQNPKDANRAGLESARSKFVLSSAIRGAIAVGDMVELQNSDGSGRDGTLRKVIATGTNWIEVDKPLTNDPDIGGVIVYKWAAGEKNLTPDYHLRADSPAIDSADSGVNRAKDADGHEAFDVPDVKNTGAGKAPYLDRGAFEYVPAK